ncbi:hypothetical protein PPL_03243 [Heterostelium album PN500]|uniref:Ankyrin repeat protein n=1 Tax=Heterostelium pallidum (strain ATCC 26659 / Pp 5 / PN500) TaxID=670386 RepID=D3B4C1_HETP5|nr:hypothetical protein PPL_03243 [Heterostelium album PN500]EFA84169.1 hypothetical protein PPL_03243 [Heterostelium album PN500]|eukprot:XP_020436286.1 hypothetical protein PPL_03243 [Heterostelium album PN500]
MNKDIFNKVVINNKVLNQIIFENVVHINKLDYRDSFRWEDLLETPYVMAGNGYFEELKQFYARKTNYDEDIYQSEFFMTYSNAVQFGAIEPIIFFMEHEKLRPIICDESNFYILNVAAMHGRTAIIHYLIGASDHWRAIHYYEALAWAPLSNDFELLKYLTELVFQPAPKEQVINLNIRAYENSAQVGRIDMFDYLTNTRFDGRKFARVYARAIEYGQYKFVKGLLKRNVGIQHERENLFDCAASHNRFDILTLLHSRGYFGEENSKAFDHAASNGNISMLDWLNSNCSTLKCSNDAVNSAASAGRLEVLQWIHKNRTESITSSEAMDLAAHSGHLHIVQYLHNNLTTGCSSKAIDDAATFGYLELVKFLHLNRTERGKMPLELALENGHIETVLWMNANGINYDSSKGRTDKIMKSAVKNNFPLIVEWMINNIFTEITLDNLKEYQEALNITLDHKEFDQLRDIINNAIELKTKLIFRYVSDIHQKCLVSLVKVYRWNELLKQPCLLVYYGYFEQLKNFYDNELSIPQNLELLQSSKAIFFDQANVFRAAAVVGRFDIFKYLWDRFDTSNKLELFYQSQINDNYSDPVTPILMAAITNGRIEIVRYLFELNIIPARLGDTQEAFIKSPMSNSLSMVQLLSERLALAQVESTATTTSVNISRIYEKAATVGNIGIIEWLFTNRPKDTGRDNMYRGAIVGGHIDVVRYLIEDHSIARPDFAAYHAFQSNNLEILKLLDHHKFNIYGITPNKAVINNNIEMLQWIHQRIPNLSYSNDLIELATSKSNLEIVRWLTENTSAKCTTKAMDQAAKLNCLDLVKYLHFNRSEGCSSDAMDGAAELGHFEVVRWLNENRSEGCSTNAMDYASRNDHLHVLKYLHENRTEGCSNLAMDLATDLEVIKFLVANRTERFDTTVTIKMAVVNENLQIIRWLFDNNYVTGIPETTLKRVIYCRNAELLEWFILNVSDFKRLIRQYSDELTILKTLLRFDKHQLIDNIEFQNSSKSIELLNQLLSRLNINAK